ncbi:hypothetical protein GDO86_012928 [Hymenochirus boettgeri]|uniref:Uncharacterized protein n=1 Tax=Hymenochirus boettgeri TaxID=247094 RepID=A0A8T2IUR1_9PIPI|nr:hypothetical protein GDO86_012928 [Hymenochirus boettgeri]
MSCPNIACIGFLLILFLSKDPVQAKPMSSLQSLSRILEENFERPYGYEGDDQEKEPLDPTDSLDQDSELQWVNVDKAGNPHLEVKLQQLLNDPINTSRKYRLRNKKGLSRGCYGVRLDRIGSLSGLGC